MIFLEFNKRYRGVNLEAQGNSREHQHCHSGLMSGLAGQGQAQDPPGHISRSEYTDNFSGHKDSTGHGCMLTVANLRHCHQSRVANEAFNDVRSRLRVCKQRRVSARGVHPTSRTAARQLLEDRESGPDRAPPPHPLVCFGNTSGRAECVTSRAGAAPVGPVSDGMSTFQGAMPLPWNFTQLHGPRVVAGHPEAQGVRRQCGT